MSELISALLSFIITLIFHILSTKKLKKTFSEILDEHGKYGTDKIKNNKNYATNSDKDYTGLDNKLLKQLEALTERVEKIAKDEKRLFGNVRKETLVEIKRLEYEIENLKKINQLY